MKRDVLIKEIKKRLSRSEKAEFKEQIYDYPQDNNLGYQMRRIIKLASQEKFPIMKMKNDYGTFYQIDYQMNLELQFYPAEKIKEKLNKHLALVKGIRNHMENKLKKLGYYTISHLINHPCYASRAYKILNYINNNNFDQIAMLLEERLSATHRLRLHAAFLYPCKKFLLLDIETLGLYSGNALIFAGILRPSSDNSFLLRQYLIQDLDEEIAILEQIRQEIAKAKVLISYNGKAFDIPFLEYRLAYYGLANLERKMHIDLFHFIKRWYRDMLSHFSLTACSQELLSYRRKHDIPSYLVPYLFKQFLATKDKAFLLPILIHNRNDLILLLKLLNFLIKDG